MRAPLRQRFLMTAAVPALVAGAVLVSGVSGASASHTASPSAQAVHLGSGELGLVADDQKMQQIHWNVDGGAAAYKAMLQDLANLQVSLAKAHSVKVQATASSSRTVTFTNNTAIHTFADLVVTSQGQRVHLLVRLSDLYVTGFYFDASDGRHYVPITTANAAIISGADVNDHWRGTENYNKLSSLGSISLADLQIGHHSLFQAITDLRHVDTASTQAVARALLRMIFAVSEGSRFPWLSGGIYNALLNSQDFRVSNTGVELVHDWAGLSHVLADRLKNGNKSTASVRTTSFGLVDSVAKAVKLLLTALSDGVNPNPHEEL
ncbi:ribosome-inactivating family protein [Streptomyces sp. NPDC050549]|uniref:ribosome-inactivating family protein n=1 Tax=Streptomyces sp. NPDC050549 TaxID=3155406 RepID=UPI0034250D32